MKKLLARISENPATPLLLLTLAAFLLFHALDQHKLLTARKAQAATLRRGINEANVFVARMDAVLRTLIDAAPKDALAAQIVKDLELRRP